MGISRVDAYISRTVMRSESLVSTFSTSGYSCCVALSGSFTTHRHSPWVRAR